MPRNDPKLMPQSLLKLNNAMERLHDSSNNPYGRLEHIYSLDDIDEITRRVADDEWMALGSAIAEAMLETIVDISGEVLKEMGRDERMKVEERIAEDVSITVEVSYKLIVSSLFGFSQLLWCNQEWNSLFYLPQFFYH